MIKLRASKSVYSLLMASALSAHAVDPIQIDNFDLILPVGYTHHAGQGIDSDVGEITVEGKPYKIRYDVGMLGSANDPRIDAFPKEQLREVLFYEFVPNKDIKVCIYALQDYDSPELATVLLRIWTRGCGGSFQVHSVDKAKIQEVVSALRALKIGLHAH